MGKLKTAGTPLGEFVDGQIYMGIKTGLNEAFIIDETKRAELIAADSKSAELIKPYLRGRDVKRWQTQWSGLYMIVTSLVSDISQYPSVEKHLEGYKNSLLNRAGVQKWFELQHKGMDLLNFLNSSNIKIIYPDIAVKTQFAIDPENKYYISNTSYLIGNADRFLVGILNSLVVNFFYSGITSQIRGGYFRFFTQYVEQIPIANAPNDLRQQIASLAQQCLDVAKDNPDKLPVLETELNQLVYQAYGLTDDEIALIERELEVESIHQAADFLDELSAITNEDE